MSDLATRARACFPALDSGYVFADNAGGSQCLKTVADRIADYLLRTNVQLGADYSVSVESTKRASSGPASAAALFNALSPSEIALGSSSTMLVENLSRALDADIQDDQEIIVTFEHEGAVRWSTVAVPRLTRNAHSKYWPVEEARRAQGPHPARVEATLHRAE
jgi:selenocysteine lyase/cysteine desulfurase